MYGLGILDPAGKSILNRSDYYDVPRCRGANLHCANEREKTYGMENAIAGNDVIMPEVLRNQDIFGNICLEVGILKSQICRETIPNTKGKCLSKYFIFIFKGVFYPNTSCNL